jgi:hypothetical protein
MTTEIPHISGIATWRYPAAGDEPCPRATKCLILTNLGVCVIGTWGNDALAWAPMPKRDKTKEATIHDQTRTT